MNAWRGAPAPAQASYTYPTTIAAVVAIPCTSPAFAPPGNCPPSQLAPGEGQSAGRFDVATQEALGPRPVPPATAPSGESARTWLSGKLLGTVARVSRPEALIVHRRGVALLPVPERSPVPATMEPSADTQQAVVLANAVPSVLVIASSDTPLLPIFSGLNWPLAAVQRKACVAPVLEFRAYPTTTLPSAEIAVAYVSSKPAAGGASSPTQFAARRDAGETSAMRITAAT